MIALRCFSRENKMCSPTDDSWLMISRGESHRPSAFVCISANCATRKSTIEMCVAEVDREKWGKEAKSCNAAVNLAHNTSGVIETTTTKGKANNRSHASDGLKNGIWFNPRATPPRPCLTYESSNRFKPNGVHHNSKSAYDSRLSIIPNHFVLMPFKWAFAWTLFDGLFIHGFRVSFGLPSAEINNRNGKQREEWELMMGTPRRPFAAASLVTL